MNLNLYIKERGPLPEYKIYEFCDSDQTPLRIAWEEDDGKTGGYFNLSGKELFELLSKRERSLPEFSVTPLFERVIIKPIEAQEELKNGILIPDDVENTRAQAKVMSVGSETKNCKAGDTVLYKEGRGDDLYIDGELYMILSERDIDAIL